MEKQVREFHEKHGFPIGQEFVAGHPDRRALISMADDAKVWSQAQLQLALIEQKIGDERLYRAHLIAEEFAELMNAFAVGDEIKLADALGDLIYVVIGTAVTYNIPIQYVFDEIHRSNMTKPKRDPTTDPRMRNKSDGYTPPDIQTAIEHGREMADFRERTSRHGSV